MGGITGEHRARSGGRGAAGKRTRHSNPRIAYAERRVKPLARLLRCATVLRVTPILVALLFLSTCRNYKVSDERTHRIAIQAELLEDTLSQIACVNHRRRYDVIAPRFR